MAETFGATCAAWLGFPPTGWTLHYRSGFMSRPRTVTSAKGRHLRDARYERNLPPEDLIETVYQAVNRILSEGRVPFDIARLALEWSLDDQWDKMSEESVSWADDPAKARLHGGNRGVS